MIHYKERVKCRQYILDLMQKDNLSLEELKNDPRLYSEGLKMQLRKMLLEKKLRNRRKGTK